MNKATLAQVNATLDRIEKKLTRLEKHNQNLLVQLDFWRNRALKPRQSKKGKRAK